MYEENLRVVASVIMWMGYSVVIRRDVRENRYRLWVNSVKFTNFIRQCGLIDKKTVPSVLQGELVKPYRYIGNKLYTHSLVK